MRILLIGATLAMASTLGLIHPVDLFRSDSDPLAHAAQTKKKFGGKSAKASPAVSAAVRYVNAMAAGDRVAVGRLDFACQFRMVEGTMKGLKLFPKGSDPVYAACWEPIDEVNAEPVQQQDGGMYAISPGKGNLIFFSEDFKRHDYAASAFVSSLVENSTGIKVKKVGARSLGFASFRIRPGEDVVGAPATMVTLRVTYKDLLTSPVSYAPGAYQWASTVRRPRQALKAVSLNWVVLSNLKKLGFPGDVAVVNNPTVPASATHPAVPFVTEYSGYVKDSSEWWQPSDAPELLVAAVGRAAESPKLQHRVARLNRVLVIDPEQADALTALTRDLYQGILDDGAMAHQAKITDKTLEARFTEFYWDTYAQAERMDISLDMEMGGFSTPTTADYLFRMIPAMETLAEVRPNDLENRFRLGVAYRWNLDQLTAIDTHAALVDVLPPERAALRARALTELAWSRITRAAFNRTYDDPGLIEAYKEAEEAYRLSVRPLDKFVAAYTMAYSLCFTPKRDNRQILDLLSDAKRSYLEVPGASEESWRALLGNETLKPVIDADPALHRLVAAESRG